MRRYGFGRRPVRFAPVLLLVGTFVAVLLAFGAGTAAASGSYTCTGVESSDEPAVNGLLGSGGTVTLFGPKPCVGTFTATVNVTIQGVNSASLDATNATPAPAGSTLTINGGLTVTVRNLTIRGGLRSNFGAGGGIRMNCCGSTVNLTAVIVTGNTAFKGGGIYNAGGRLNVTNSTISFNTATREGGGIAVDDGGAVTLTGVTVTRNSASGTRLDRGSGGGIDLDGAELAAVASTISSNTALGPNGGDGNGGGIHLEFADVSLMNTKVSFNHADDEGGGIANDGGTGGCNSLAVLVCANPTGNAPPLPAPGSGLTITNSSVDHNTAGEQSTSGDSGDGGGIENATNDGDATLTIMNSSVSFNVAYAGSDNGFNGFGGDGGGIHNTGSDVSGATASIFATGLSMGGNQAVNGDGGGIYTKAGDGATALVTLQGSPIQNLKNSLNANKAYEGGGIYNDNTHTADCDPSVSNVSLQPGTSIVHNQASFRGGGILLEGNPNDITSGLLIAPGVVIMTNSPDNIFFEDEQELCF